MTEDETTPSRDASSARANLKEVSVHQFAGGVAVAIAAVGFARGGRDVWLAVALLVFAALFALRAYQLTADLQARDRIGAHDSGEKGEDLAGVLAPTEHVRHVGHRGRK